MNITLKPIVSFAAGMAMLPLVACSGADKPQVNAVAEQTNLNENQQVQVAMKDYVNKLIADDGLMPILHEGKILQLQLSTSEKYPDGFHEGVSNHGDLFASCADFIDPKTQDKYDIDFLVSKANTDYVVVQPLVHSKNGKKTPYDLDH